MDKKQKVRFRLPEDFYLPEKAEGWLEEKAAEGLFLQSLGRKWAVFIKGEPEEAAYMLVPMDPDDMKGPAEQGGEYKKFGWEYVTQLRRMVLVLRGSRGQCERIQELKGQSIYEKLLRKLKGSAWGLFTPFIFWLIWLVASSYLMGYGMLLLAVKGYCWVVFLGMGLCGLSQAGSWQEARLVQRLLREMEIRFKKELRGGGEIKAQDNKETGTITAGRANAADILYRVMLTFFAVCTVFGLLGGINAAVSRKKMVLTGNAAAYEEDGWKEGDFRTASFLKKHPAWKTLSPALIPLNKIQQNEELEYRVYTYKGKNQDSYSLVTGSLLAPVQAEVVQYGKWKEGGNSRESTLKLEYYQTLTPKLASAFLKELGRYYMHWYKGWVPEKVESSYFDELVIHDRGLHYLFARKGNQVIFAYYIGDEMLTDHLPEFEQAVETLGGG